MKRKAKKSKPTTPAGFDPGGPYMVKVAEVYGVSPDTDKVIRIPIFCDVPPDARLDPQKEGRRRYELA